MVDEYVDDGYSGTNFERPAFKRLLEDVKKKKINCIIVKDLSRLERILYRNRKIPEKDISVSWSKGLLQLQIIMTVQQNRMMQTRSLFLLKSDK